MKCRVEIDPTRDEEAVIYAHGETDEIRAAVRAIEGIGTRLIGTRDGESIPISPEEVICIYTDGGRVMAETDEGTLRLRERMYTLEELLPEGFVRINQSCIANTSRIKRFSASYGGALSVIFENGRVDYVSRRQLRTVKRRFGL